MSLKLDGNKIVGYVAVYNSPSKLLQRDDGTQFIEVIKPGAFAATLSDNHQIMALSAHDDEAVLGSTTAGTLKITDDTTGLLVEIDLPNTTAANDLKALLGRGEPFGGSFRASVVAWDWKIVPDKEYLLCELTALELVEVTITAFPAYPETSVVLRSKRKPETPVKSAPVVDDSWKAENEVFQHRMQLVKF